MAADSRIETGIMPFDLRQLRYAIAAADQHSFHRAADLLRLKQSTLSRRIRQMEERLGTPLFERSRAGVRLTIAGVAFLRSARCLVAQADMMAAAAVAVSRGEAGRLTVGFYTSLSAGNLRATLLDYVHRFPNVEVFTVQDSRAHLIGQVMSGAVDIAIVTGDPNGENHKTMPLWSERILVALPEDHPLASHEIVFWSDLRGETFLLSHYGSGQDFHDLLVAKLASPGDRPKVVRHEVGCEAIKSLVGARFGVTLLCDACVGVAHAGVVYREARDGNGPCRIGYTAHWREDNDNPALASFLKLLRERHQPLSDKS